jgi:hypothetical protein
MVVVLRIHLAELRQALPTGDLEVNLLLISTALQRTFTHEGWAE